MRELVPFVITRHLAGSMRKFLAAEIDISFASSRHLSLLKAIFGTQIQIAATDKVSCTSSLLILASEVITVWRL